MATDDFRSPGKINLFQMKLINNRRPWPISFFLNRSGCKGDGEDDYSDRYFSHWRGRKAKVSGCN
jgi:hypothetical protein